MQGLHLSVGAVHLTVGAAVAIVGLLSLAAVSLAPTRGLAAGPTPTSTLTPVSTATPSRLPSSTPTATSSSTVTATSISTATSTSTAMSTSTPTSTATATSTPTATPLPVIACTDARKIVQDRRRTTFDFLNVVTSGAAFACGNPARDGAGGWSRPVTASWTYAGRPYAAVWLVSLDGNASAANPTAQTIDRVGSVGDLLRDLK